MFGKRETDVLVVGAGPVGLFTALCLREHGVAVEVIDSQRRTAARSYALALHPQSLELLAGSGLAGALIRAGSRISRIALCDRVKERAAIHLEALGGTFPFVLVVPQKTLEAALEKRLRAEGVRVRWNHRLSRLAAKGARVSASVDVLRKESLGYPIATSAWVIARRETTNARFVIGADGFGSGVRRALGIDFESIAPPARYEVFELEASAGSLSEVRVMLGAETADVFWPLASDRCRFSFQVAEDEGALGALQRAKSRLAIQIDEELYPHADQERFHQLVARRAPWFDAAIGDLTWSVSVRFESRLAKRFGEGAVWLAGDAAHLWTPIGVHSMNAGLREAHELARIIAVIVRDGVPHDRLDAYGREQQAAWQQLLATGQAAEVGSRADAWVRAHAARIPACIPASGEALETLLGQLAIGVGSRAYA